MPYGYASLIQGLMSPKSLAMVYLTGKKFFLESKAIRVTRARRAIREKKATKEIKASRACVVCKVRLVSRVFLALQERTARLLISISSIRQ